MRELRGVLLWTLCMTATIGHAQSLAVQSQAAQEVTLEARRKTSSGDNYIDAAFSFEFGTHGALGKQVTHNDWDILFGNYPDRDTFDVTMVTNDCSRIVDLGPRLWSDASELPALPAYEVPTREPSVDAIMGHMYLVHTKDSDSDLYALFRVEDLEPRHSVTISWKLVR